MTEVMFVFHLQARQLVGDLFEGFRDGHHLLTLLEVLSGESLVSAATERNP